MNSDYLVSAVIPTHKRSSVLERAVVSALNQSYPCHEIIVVSDGFDIETDRLMHRLQLQYKQIIYRCVEQPQGANHARNAGAMLATGEFLAFLDDDDEWHQEKNERQLRVFQTDDSIGLVCTAYNSVFLDTGKSFLFTPSAEFDNSKSILLRNTIGSTTSVMLKKDVFERAGMFDERLRAMQDYELWIRVCQLTHVGVVREPSVQYYNDKKVAQISNNTEKYIESYNYIMKKHGSLFRSVLSSRGTRKRESRMLEAISKKALRNSQPRIAREYARKAILKGGIIIGVLCYVASFVPYELLIKMKATFDKRFTW